MASSWYLLVYAALMTWIFSTFAILLVRAAGLTRRSVAAGVVFAAALGLMQWQFQRQAWERDYSADAAEADVPRLHLSQQILEEQQTVWERAIAALAPQREGVTDVYGLVFAPYASEDVFLRESTMVSKVLAERFDADGRIVHLLNHATTAKTHPWATTLNLQRAIDAIAQRMDRENDVLVVYMTSHGASDFKLAAWHWPLEVEPLSPRELRAALDKAGIRNRVIGISACYSGGWVNILSDENTLVMTAADATHTSYGCGHRSKLTFFGRALFDEQLRSTHSFEQAFAKAVPVIRQRELDAGKQDGFSNPQIRTGAGIVPVLRALEERLDALTPPTVAPPPAAAASAKARP